MVVEALKTGRSWTILPIRLVADGAYNRESTLTPLRGLGIPLVSRLRTDARLRENPPQRRRKQRGRIGKYGKALPSLTAMRRANRGWKRIKVEIYGRDVSMDIKSFVAWWPKSSQDSLSSSRQIRNGDGRRGAVRSSTNLKRSPEEVIEVLARRWSIEQLFADAKQTLGLDSAEVRSERSVVT